MAFQGTQTKCKVCSKTVYLMEQLIADGVIFHRACFRCNHCKGTLQLNNFASLEGVLYCKPHFEQLFKKTGSYDRSFEGAIKADKEKPPPPQSVTGGAVVPSKVKEEKVKTVNPLAARFGGTQEKCKVCGKTVYPLEKVSVENTTYHNMCFKCAHGGCKLTAATYRALQGKLYCKHHFTQLFLTKGNYSALSNQNGAGAGGEASGASEAADTPSDAVAAPAAAESEPSSAGSALAAAKAEPPKPAPPAKKPVDSDDSDDDSDDD